MLQAIDQRACVVSKAIAAQKDKKTARTHEDAGRGQSIVLVGIMGAGKSTVGRLLAQALKMPFTDSDDEIVSAAGMSISDIFAEHGEPEFRRLEQRVIARLLDGDPMVLATGGGAFMNEETRQLVQQKADSVWLKADLETLWRRVSRRGGRPLLDQPDPKKTLKDLLEQREPYYAQANHVVVSKDGPHSRTVRAIRKALKR